MKKHEKIIIGIAVVIGATFLFDYLDLKCNPSADIVKVAETKIVKENVNLKPLFVLYYDFLVFSLNKYLL